MSSRVTEVGVATRRVALAIDLENLVVEREEFEQDRILSELLSLATGQGTVVYAVAVCDHRLAKKFAHRLSQDGVRTYVHRGGLNAADAAIIRRLEYEIPSSCNVLVLATGDGAFVTVASALRESGMKVVVASWGERLSRALVIAADSSRAVPSSPVRSTLRTGSSTRGAA